VNSSNIEQFIRERKLVAQDFEECKNMDLPRGPGNYSPNPTWRQSGIKLRGECYLYDNVDPLFLVYFPANQLAYTQESDW
jgi:hypothetical protein